MNHVYFHCHNFRLCRFLSVFLACLRSSTEQENQTHNQNDFYKHILSRREHLSTLIASCLEQSRTVAEKCQTIHCCIANLIQMKNVIVKLLEEMLKFEWREEIAKQFLFEFFNWIILCVNSKYKFFLPCLWYKTALHRYECAMNWKTFWNDKSFFMQYFSKWCVNSINLIILFSFFIVWLHIELSVVFKSNVLFS